MVAIFLETCRLIGAKGRLRTTERDAVARVRARDRVILRNIAAYDSESRSCSLTSRTVTSSVGKELRMMSMTSTRVLT